VGSAPISLITFINTWVPYLGRPWPVTALSASTFFAAVVACTKAPKSRIPATPLVPRIATAFRFFDPITAPTPERPAARCRSLTMQANSTWFSPATPIEDTRTSGSCSSCLICSSVSQQLLPHSPAASRSSARSFSM